MSADEFVETLLAVDMVLGKLPLLTGVLAISDVPGVIVSSTTPARICMSADKNFDANQRNK